MWVLFHGITIWHSLLQASESSLLQCPMARPGPEKWVLPVWERPSFSTPHRPVGEQRSGSWIFHCEGPLLVLFFSLMSPKFKHILHSLSTMCRKPLFILLYSIQCRERLGDKQCPSNTTLGHCSWRRKHLPIWGVVFSFISSDGTISLDVLKF